MEIILNGTSFNFSHSAKLVPKDSPYDLELVEPDFDEKTSSFFSGGVDANLKLPLEIEMTVSRTSLLPVAKIFKDQDGKMKLTAYFD